VESDLFTGPRFWPPADLLAAPRGHGSHPRPETGQLARKRPLLAVAVLIFRKLGQYVGRITAAAVCKPAQLIHVTSFARQLNELVDSVSAALTGQPTQLIHVTPLARQLNKLVDSVLITACGQRSQIHQIMISHVGTSHSDRWQPVARPRPGRSRQGHHQT
jgi:hypothetical protein